MEGSQPDPGGDRNFQFAQINAISNPVKLFIGQIPRTWEDSEVRQILEPFGAIRDLTVLKDRSTGVHKGCAFVTFISRQSAIEAQNSLHEKKTLPGMNHPMQVKPATSEPKFSPVEERRLFVGMLCRDYAEENVRAMFSPYGHVDDVSILRNAEGRSKGAAFVRLSSRFEALQAITGLHQSQTMPGCSAPLVVKIADTEKEKNAKRLHGTLPTVGEVNCVGMNALGGLNPIHAAAYYQLLQLQATQTRGGTASSSVNNSFGLGTPLDLAIAAYNQQHAPSALTQPASNFSSHIIGGVAGASSLGNLSSAMLSAANTTLAQSMGGKPKRMGMTAPDSLMSAYLGMQPGLQQFQQIPSGQGYILKQQQKALLYSKQKEGPDGCNLFIYHLPNDVTDRDLIQMFGPFGSVVSAKVFIDKVTNLSKCFGFVSFDNALSASRAIQAMNGFQMGTKRLKVQLKKPKENSRPY